MEPNKHTVFVVHVVADSRGSFRQALELLMASDIDEKEYKKRIMPQIENVKLLDQSTGIENSKIPEGLKSDTDTYLISIICGNKSQNSIIDNFYLNIFGFLPGKIEQEKKERRIKKQEKK